MITHNPSSNIYHGSQQPSVERGRPEDSHPRGTSFFMYYAYLIECKDGTLYTGITTDIQRRFKEHSSGKGGAYTRSKKVERILHTEQFETRSQAQKREAEIKSWRRKKKLALIKNNP